MKCCELLVSLCSRHHSSSSSSANSNSNSANNNNSLINNKNNERLIWLDQPTSVVVVAAAAAASREHENSSRRLETAARALERRLSWSPTLPGNRPTQLGVETFRRGGDTTGSAYQHQQRTSDADNGIKHTSSRLSLTSCGGGVTRPGASRTGAAADADDEPPAAVHQAVVNLTSCCRSLPSSLDFLVPSSLRPAATECSSSSSSSSSSSINSKTVLLAGSGGQHECRSAPATPQLLHQKPHHHHRPNRQQEQSSHAAADAGAASIKTMKTTTTGQPVLVMVPKRRFLRLIADGDVQVCRTSHSGTVIGKILSSKLLRRWETHHLYLNDAQISSKTPTGFMEESVPYSSIKDISLVLSPSSASSSSSASWSWWSASSSGPSVMNQQHLLASPDQSMSNSAPSLVTTGVATPSTTTLLGASAALQRCCLVRIALPDGCLLLQANNAYVRDQWYHSIIWKKNLFRYHQITRRTTRQEVLLKEVKSMVELATTTPLTDHCIAQAPFQVISSLLSTEKPAAGNNNATSQQQQQQEQQQQQQEQQASGHQTGNNSSSSSIGMPGGCNYSQSVLEDLLLTLSPLLERQPPSREMCAAFSRHCRLHPRSNLVRGLFTSVVHRILKHNVDFGKNPYMRRLVHDYLRVLYAHNDGPQAVRDFVQSAHGEGSACPHPRVLPNLVAVCLAAAFGIYEHRRRQRSHPSDWVNVHANHDDKAMENGAANESHHNNRHHQANNGVVWDMECCLAIFNAACEYDDWRPGLAQLLQPVPFPDDALADDAFIKGMSPVIGSIGKDQRCAVHQCVLGIRDGKEGWFHVICPSSAACADDGSLWASILKTLLDCCCRRKAFLASMTKMVGACQLLALRDQCSAQEALCLMLEWSLLDGHGDQQQQQQQQQLGGDERSSVPLQVATTLQSTESGRKRYFELCDRQLHLKELQQKGGPKKLTLPSRSTDDDLAKLLLNCGSLGNLECLSLAFTHVTSASAEHLIKLPSLRYLNLWSTQFGDAGLQLISEHLHKLQVLNLCETPVTDKGLACLASMKSLRKLNLNSTNLSASTFEKLKQTLPCLQECDVRYTDAW